MFDTIFVPYENLNDKEKNIIDILENQLYSTITKAGNLNIDPNLVLLALERITSSFRKAGEQVEINLRGEEN